MSNLPRIARRPGSNRRAAGGFLLALRLVSLLLALSLPSAARQDDPSPVTHEERGTVVRELAGVLRRTYVFPDVGERIAARLEANLAEGSYADATDPEVFARRLTEDLRSVNDDRHLAVWVVPEFEEPRDPGEGYDYWPTHGRPANYGFRHVEVLDGNVGYLRLGNFSMDEWYADACRAATAAMGVLADTDAVLIDLRGNPGGGARLIWFLASYFFGPEPVHLNDYFMRIGNRTIECWTQEELPGRRLPDVPLFVLVDGDTFSAGEGFAYSLKHLGRATIVGERTGGGSHGGSSHVLHRRFEAYVSNSCSVHPVTGGDFEGVGVEPDVEVASANCLPAAHRLALQRLLQDTEANPSAVRFYRRALERVEGREAAPRSAASSTRDEAARTVEHAFESEFLGSARRVRVRLPASYDGTRTHSVIYTFDAVHLFDPVWAAAEFLAREGSLPPTIVVGIHFEDGARDDDMGIQWTQGTLNARGRAFFHYVRDELRPFVDQHYATSGHTTIVGHSNSATYLNFFLFAEDGPVFDNSIALSQLTVGDLEADLERIFGEAREHPLFLYVGIAGHDSSDRIENPRAARDLLQRLDPPSWFRPRFAEFPDADHGGIALVALPEALRTVFRPYVGLRATWTYDPSRATFVHSTTGETIATWFDERGRNPLAAALDERRLAQELYALEDAKLPVADLEVVSAYGVEKQDVVFLHEVAEAFVRDHPADPVVLQVLAQRFRSIGAWDPMEEYFWKFDELPEVHGKQPFAYDYLFHSFDTWMRDPERAWDLLDKFRVAYPEEDRVLALYGKLSLDYAYRVEEGRLALEEYLRATADQPAAQARGHLLLGRLEAANGEAARARLHLECALELRPGWDEARVALEALERTERDEVR